MKRIVCPTNKEVGSLLLICRQPERASLSLSFWQSVCIVTVFDEKKNIQFLKKGRHQLCLPPFLLLLLLKQNGLHHPNRLILFLSFLVYTILKSQKRFTINAQGSLLFEPPFWIGLWTNNKRHPMKWNFQVVKKKLTKNDDECHFDSFNFSTWDDSSRAGPPTFLILVQHGRSGASTDSMNPCIISCQHVRDNKSDRVLFLVTKQKALVLVIDNHENNHTNN